MHQTIFSFSAVGGTYRSRHPPRVQPQEQLDAAAEASASADAPALQAQLSDSQAQLSDSQAAVQELQVRTCM